MALRKPQTATNMKPDTDAEVETAVAEQQARQAVDRSQPADMGFEEDDTAVTAATSAPAREVATMEHSRPSAPSTGTAMMAPVESDGFDALDDEIGFGSFPMLILDKDKFTVSGQEFDQLVGVIHSVRKKYLFKVALSEDDARIVYSYDGERGTDGRPLSEHFAEWRADGYDKQPSQSDYIEAVFQINDETAGELNGSIVLLSIPPASVKRLAGYRAEVRTLRKVPLNGALTRLCKAAKVTLGNKKSFYPWDFKFVARLEG